MVGRHRTRVWHFKNGGLGGFGGNPPGGNGGGFSENSLKWGVWGVRGVSKNPPIEQSSKKTIAQVQKTNCFLCILLFFYVYGSFFINSDQFYPVFQENLVINIS